MRKNLLHASLINSHEISIIYIPTYNSIDEVEFFLIGKRDRKNIKIHLKKTSFNNKKIPEAILYSEEEIILGFDYSVYSSEEESVYLDLDDYVQSEEFDEKYAYDGNDLGPIYSPSSTEFRLWSPLADKVMLKLEKNDNSFLLYEMSTRDRGIFYIRLKGDLFNKRYSYIVKVNGREKEILDPYAKATSLNSEYSVVIDMSIVESVGKIKSADEFKRYNDAIIYELNIRDFTEKADVNYPGTYIGLTEKIDYLKVLGITHVQLLPVLDFATGDDLVKNIYNWGYDPIGFFCLEGSYSSLPEDPISRLIEFKNMVNTFHQNNIRVVLDVVYNHLYDYANTGFQANVPYYYFRKYHNKMCNASGCGNDFATERKMARKIILDSVRYLLETFDVDGFRFDLLGLIDIDTTKDIISLAKSIKPDVILYGEGWHMDTNLPDNKKSSSLNADQIPEMAFFNDTYRDLIKGHTFELTDKGYISGNLNNKVEVEHLLLGSVLSDKFKHTSQSINYVECHDNQTLFDKLTNIYVDKSDILKRIKLANALTILSLGVPFIHMGQEIGLSKHGLDNTYNIPNINNMDWKMVEERKDMVKYMSDLIKIRKNFELLKLDDKEIISDTFDMFQLKDGILNIAIRNQEYLHGNKKAVIIINPTNKNIPVEFDEYFTLFLGSNGLVDDEFVIKNHFASAGSIDIYYLK